MKIYGLLTLFFTGGGSPPPAAAAQIAATRTQATRKTERTSKT